MALGLKWGTGLLLLAGALLVWYLNSASFQEMARARIVSAIEGRFPVRVELDSVRVRWWGVRLELAGLRIFNQRFGEAEAAVEIDRIDVFLTVTSFWRPAASLDSVHLESPRIRIVKNPNGRFNLWNMFRKETDIPPKLTAFIRLAIDDLSVRDGLILFQDQSFHLESSRGGLGIEMEFEPRTQSYRGLVKLAGVDLDAGPFALAGLDSTMRIGLFENSIEFDAVDLACKQVEGTASGVIDDLGQLVYRFNVDLRVVPTAFERPDFAAIVDEGEVRAVGVFTGSKGDWGFGGEISSSRLVVRDLVFEDLESALRADSKSLAVDRVSARFQGGAVRGRGELAWNEADLSAFDVEGNGLRLERLLAPLPLAPFRPRGTAAGAGRVQWRGLNWESIDGSGKADFRGDFRFLPAGVKAGEARAFPFSGRADFSLDRVGADFSGAVVELLEGGLKAEGAIGFDGSYDTRLSFEASGGRAAMEAAAESGILSGEALASWRPAAPGTTRLTAQLRGSGREFALTGEASCDAVQVNQAGLGALTAGFDLNPRGVRLESFRIDGPGGRWTGSLAYEFASKEPGRWVELSIAGQGDADRLASLAGLEQPLSGRLSGDFRIEEPAPGRIVGRGSFDWNQPGWERLRLDSAKGELEWEGNQLQVSSLSAGLGPGTIDGRVSYNFESARFDAALAGRRVPLAGFLPLSESLEGADLDGLTDFTLKASGTAERPRFEITATSDALRFGGRELTKLRLSASDGGSAGGPARFDLEAAFFGDRLSASGQVGLDAPYPLDASLELDRFPLGPSLKMLPYKTDIELDGEVTGSIEVTGPLADLGALEATGTFDRIRLQAADYEVQNRNNVTLVYKNGSLRLLPLTMVGPQTELNVVGTVELGGSRTLDLKTNGKANLLLLNSFLTGGSTFGQLTLETVLTGTLDEPRIVGQASLEKGFLRHPSIPGTFFDARGKFRFTANQIGIDEFSARTPYGTLNAEGGVFLDGLTPQRWLVNVYGSGLRLEYPEQVFSVLDVDLDWINNEESQLLSGVVYVRSAEYAEQISLTDLILRYGAGADLLSPATPGGEVVLDIEVEGYRTLQINNNLAKVTASGDFKLRGTLQDPVILGSLTVDDGKLFLENNEYEVTRGAITFNDPRSTRPVFDFEAETEVRDFSVSVILRGPIDQFNVSFRSDPPLPNSSIVSLLAVGQTEEEIFGVEGRGQDQVGSLAIYGAGALLSKSLGKKLEAETSRLFGFDKLSIDPFLYGSERDPGARVTLGKRLGKDLTVTYSTDLGNEGQGQIVVVEYKLTDWLTVVGTGEQTGAVAVDFKLRKRF